MNAEDFQQLRDHVYDQTGIVLGEEKQYLVDSRLKPVMKAFEYADWSELVNRLKNRPDPALSQSVIDAVTTNETSFLRDGSPFEALRNEVLPHLINQRQRERSLVIWSAACSSGQEAYSVLMTIHEYFPDLIDWRIEFLCTDISSEMVARTKEGVYSSLEVNRGLPANLMVKYFDQVEQSWVVKDMLRQRLKVTRLNLHEAWYGIPRCDIILLRNVLIYFDQETRQRMLERAYEHLKTDGVLFLGASESTMGVSERFESKMCGRGRYFVPVLPNAGT